MVLVSCSASHRFTGYHYCPELRMSILGFPWTGTPIKRSAETPKRQQNFLVSSKTFLSSTHGMADSFGKSFRQILAKRTMARRRKLFRLHLSKVSRGSAKLGICLLHLKVANAQRRTVITIESAWRTWKAKLYWHSRATRIQAIYRSFLTVKRYSKAVWRIVVCQSTVRQSRKPSSPGSCVTATRSLSSDPRSSTIRKQHLLVSNAITRLWHIHLSQVVKRDAVVIHGAIRRVIARRVSTEADDSNVHRWRSSSFSSLLSQQNSCHRRDH
jgi:hypothetical protein